MGTALAESQVINVGTGDVEPIRIGEHRLIPIAGRKPHHDLLAGLDLLAAKLDIPSRRAPEVVDRRSPAQKLLHCTWNQLRLLLQQFQLILVLDQCQHRLTDRVPGRLIARDHEQQEVVVEVTR